jgi:aspartate oxidase
MTETLAKKKPCTPCRGGIAPLTHEEAERFRAQASDQPAMQTREVVAIAVFASVAVARKD